MTIKTRLSFRIQACSTNIVTIVIFIIIIIIMWLVQQMWLTPQQYSKLVHCELDEKLLPKAYKRERDCLKQCVMVSLQ